MSIFAAIDVTALAAPLVVEALAFEDVLAAMLADLGERDPAFTAFLESDPALKILQVCAYRETVMRQRVNDAARSLLLAYAVGPDLDQLGANLRVPRLVLSPAIPDAVPPVPAVMESDDDFRRRLQLDPEGYTTAGSEGAYVFHALGADPRVKDASAYSPADGRVEVRILSRAGAGTAPDDLLATVGDYLSARERRPLTDKVAVLSADVQGYRVVAVLTCYPGPDPALAQAAAAAGVAAYAARTARLGYDVTRSGLFAALHVAGVQNVALVEPAEDLVCDATQAPALLGTDIRLAEVTDV